MSTDYTGFRGAAVTVTAAGVQVLSDDRIPQEHAMTVPDPAGRPQIERPIDLTDTPGHDTSETPGQDTPQHGKPGPAPTPEHHPDRVDRRGDDGVVPASGVTTVD